MSQVRVHNFSVSLDGFGTGAGQSLDAPFGHAGTRLHEWFFPTRTFRAMHGQPRGSTGIDDAFASAWAPGIGADLPDGGSGDLHSGHLSPRQVSPPRSVERGYTMVIMPVGFHLMRGSVG